MTAWCCLIGLFHVKHTFPSPTRSVYPRVLTFLMGG